MQELKLPLELALPVELRPALELGQSLELQAGLSPELLLGLGLELLEKRKCRWSWSCHRSC